MKLIERLFIVVSLCAFCIAGWGQAQPETRILSLDECVNIALEKNRAILIAHQNLKIAQGRVTEAKGAGNAKLSAFGEANDRSDEVDLPLAVGIDQNQQLIIEEVPFVPNAASSVGVRLNQPIDISGVIHAGTKAAHYGEQAAQMGVKRTYNDVILQTKIAYYNVLRNEELLLAAEEAMKNAEIRLKTAQALVETGISSKVDITRAEAGVSAAKQQVITAQNGVQISKSSLNDIIGYDINTPIELQKVDISTMEIGTYEICLDEALSNRPEVAISSLNTSASQQRYKVAKRGMSPSLAFSAVGQIDDAYHVPEDRSITVALGLTIPLSDGGETAGRKEQAAADIQASRIQEDDIKSLVALQVKNAYVHVQNADEKLATANKEFEQAAETLRLSQARYEEGMASQVELSDAELIYTQAQTNVANAHFELLSSRSELDRALGRYASQNSK